MKIKINKQLILESKYAMPVTIGALTGLAAGSFLSADALDNEKFWLNVHKKDIIDDVSKLKSDDPNYEDDKKDLTRRADEHRQDMLDFDNGNSTAHNYSKILMTGGAATGALTGLGLAGTAHGISNLMSKNKKQ